MKVLVFGEILWDIIDQVPHLGGAPLNFAAHIRQFGNEVAIISCLGNDDLGDEALTKVNGLDIDTTFIQRSNKPTGFVPVILNNGQPEYNIIKDVAYDYIESNLLDHTSIKAYDTFYFGSIIQRSPKSKQSIQHILANHQFENIFYDVNLRKDAYTLEVIEYSINHCTILKVNDEEVIVLSKMIFKQELSFESFCDQISKHYPKIQFIIMTAGKEGCSIYLNDEIIKILSEPIEVLDTVGAGDSFSAAFLAVFSKTADPIESAEIANKVGGFVASSHGAVPKYSKELRQVIDRLYK